MCTRKAAGASQEVFPITSVRCHHHRAICRVPASSGLGETMCEVTETETHAAVDQAREKPVSHESERSRQRRKAYHHHGLFPHSRRGLEFPSFPCTLIWTMIDGKKHSIHH